MIALVYGSRPEAIKLGPVAAELRAAGTPFKVVATGQHSDLLLGTPAESDLGGGVELGIKSEGRLTKWLHDVGSGMARALSDAAIVVVQGDTQSALAGALAAHRAGKLLAHVEAGVRSHNQDEPWPEEMIRYNIDQMASYCFAATELAKRNLVDEGKHPSVVAVTGNTVVSALARYSDAKAGTPPSDHLVVTLHRREFWSGRHFFSVLDALCEAARDHAAAKFVWPIHPNIEKRLSQRWLESVPSNFLIVKPFSYRVMASTLASAFGVLTDSGGLVEEAATLGVPSVQLRNVSDRPEAIGAGVSRLCAPTAAGVHEGVSLLTTGAIGRHLEPVYGGVHAAAEVARHLALLREASKFSA